MPRAKMICVVAALAAVATLATLLEMHWPYTRARMTHSLEGPSQCNVHFGRFRQIFFPRPGCVIEDVAFVRGSNASIPPLIFVRTLKVEGSWAATLTFSHRVTSVRAAGLQVSIPAQMPKAQSGTDSGHSKTMIGELIADGAVLVIARSDPSQEPIRFRFPQLVLHDVSHDHAIGFHTVIQNPEPPSTVRAQGRLGPWRSDDEGSSPVSGSFDLTHGDLGHYHGIAGIIASKGEFSGSIARIEVHGRVETPDFAVTSSHHALPLRVEYRALVDALNGDTTLTAADAAFLHTLLKSHGSIEGRPGQRAKVVEINFNAQRARIQDLLRMFVRSDRPALNGPIVFRAHVVLPPEHRPFLRRLRLDGDFGITDAEFSSPITQKNVDRLSERARGEEKNDKTGEDAENVVSGLKGHVMVRNGVARLSNVSFTVPGALARMQGTYDLITHHINLRGTLAMQASLSEATTGIKSWLLKPLSPFFKRKHAGAVVAVSITGAYPHPSYKVSLH
jgi:hypothetical protein